MNAEENPNGQGGASGRKERVFRDLTNKIDMGHLGLKPNQVGSSGGPIAVNGKELELLKKTKEAEALMSGPQVC